MVCTTVSPDFAKEMDNKCAKKGLLYLDAPISGGSKKSLECKLSYMISGSQKALQKAEKAKEGEEEDSESSAPSQKVDGKNNKKKDKKKKNM